MGDHLRGTTDHDPGIGDHHGEMGDHVPETVDPFWLGGGVAHVLNDRR